MSRSLSELGEFGLIRELKELLPPVPEGWTGIGDDCAVIPLRSNVGNTWQVVTTDSLVEGVHFRRSTASPFAIGWKLLAISISDICAMAARPTAAVVSIQLPSSVEVDWIKEFYRGIATLAAQEGVVIVGGNTAKSAELSFCLTAWGESSLPPVCRNGAIPGDDLWVSGEIGASYLGLQFLEKKLSPDKLSDKGARVIAQHSTPTPRTDLARVLSEQDLLHAMIDVSDGLLQDAHHLARAGKVDLFIDVNAVPHPVEATVLGVSSSDLLVGGEDFELLFVAPQVSRAAIRACGLATLIGSVRGASEGNLFIRENDTEKQVALWLKSQGLESGGFDHFPPLK